MHPIRSVAIKREEKKLNDTEAVKREKQVFQKGKTERKAYYTRM